MKYLTCVLCMFSSDRVAKTIRKCCMLSGTRLEPCVCVFPCSISSVSLVLNKSTNKLNHPGEEQEEQYKSEVIINAVGKQLKNYSMEALSCVRPRQEGNGFNCFVTSFT